MVKGQWGAVEEAVLTGGGVQYRMQQRSQWGDAGRPLPRNQRLCDDTGTQQFQLPMMGKWERTRASQTEGKWELQAKVGLGCGVVILWESCDHVNSIAGSKGHQEAAHIEEQDGGARPRRCTGHEKGW